MDPITAVLLSHFLRDVETDDRLHKLRSVCSCGERSHWEESRAAAIAYWAGHATIRIRSEGRL